MSNSLLKSVLQPDLHGIAAQLGPLSGQLVHIFVEFSEKAVLASTANFSDVNTTGETSLCHRLHNLDQPYRKKSDCVAVSAPRI